MAGFDDRMPSQWASPPIFWCADKVGLIALLIYGLRLTTNSLINFVFSGSIYVLLEINLMHFVLFLYYSMFVLLAFYYFLEPNRWFMFKINHGFFMMVSATVNVET
jgi:hypothetical protein